MSSGIEVKRVFAQKEIESIQRLRYEVLVDEKKFKLHGINEKSQLVIENEDTSAHLVGAFIDDTLVASALNLSNRKNDTSYYNNLYQLHEFVDASSHFSISIRYVVKDEFRNSVIPFRVILYSYLLGLNEGVSYNFLDCEPGLKPFFIRLGYEYKKEIFYPDGSPGCLMCLPMQNEEHLVNKKSPFLKYLRKHNECMLIA